MPVLSSIAGKLREIGRFAGVVFRRRPKFLLALTALFAVGVGLILFSQGTVIKGWHREWARDLAGALGDAFIIAALLAALADPVIQRRFAEEWGRGLFWAIF